MLKKLVNILTVVTICTLLSSCAPRGEYKSVNELLTKARQRYSKNFNQSSAVASDLQSLSNLLDSLVTEQRLDMAKEISESLRSLNNKAGYTTRPALNEIILQYQAIAQKQAMDNKDGTIKLIVSRTYNLLASELESTGFKL